MLTLVPRACTCGRRYVHSYQSLLWNLAASERIELHGSESVAVGDLVAVDDDAAAGADTGGAEAEDEAHGHQRDPSRWHGKQARIPPPPRKAAST